MSQGNGGSPHQRVVVIGLEAAEPTLVEQWANEGKLPTFQSLMQKGIWRRLRSTTEISSGATWASLITGTNPAKHGMGFYHRQLQPGTYTIRKKYAEQTATEPFWNQLSRHGKRVAILDLPDTYATEDLNGVMLVGWGAEGLNAKQHSWPKKLLKDIFSRVGHHPLEFWYQERPKDIAAWKAFSDKLLEGTRRRTQIAKQVLAQEAWDCYVIGYAEAHWIGHYFWHIIDKRHPDYDPELERECGDSILKIYQEIDRGIAELITMSPEATVMIVSNTGMGPNFSGQHLLPQVLEKLGYSKGPSSAGLKQLLPHQKWGPYYAIKSIETLVSAKLMETIKRVIPEKVWDSVTRRILTMGNNWKDSLAFEVPSDYSGAIRINLKGREPHGLVEPGGEFDHLCARITQDLLELVNPDTGEGAVAGVIKVKDVYQGDRLDEMQDLIVQWKGNAPVNHLESKKIGRVSGILPDKRSGAHMVNGFMLAAGRSIKTNQQLEDAHIMDIAPTLLHVLSEPIPDIMDGKVLSDILS
ncbi:MAG: alkaline phosphatase family protein [Nitrospirales bacterium]|nr:alkaline phosphatase family protein [Nitrospira sp.]MDR4502167.1 alkaline phosphatase family protein [Nitrospirales bacterium]